MKIKFLSLLLTAAMLMALVACGNTSSGKPIITDGPEMSAKPAITDEPQITTKPAKPAKTPDASGDYSNKVYYVGKDMPAGGYVINCTRADYTMDIIVFASSGDYEGFRNAKKFTVGEFSTAVELHAWANFYLKQDEKAYVGLRDGYVILLDDGQCEFKKCDPSASETVYPGVYVAGEDIKAEKINIKCTSKYMQVTLFENRDKYLEYHKTKRFTIGEESAAIKKFALSSDVIYTGNSTYANLQDDMIVVIERGMGEYSADKGPVIN